MNCFAFSAFSAFSYPFLAGGSPSSLVASLVAQTVKCLANNVGDRGSIPGWGRSPGEGNGNLLQYFCLENPWMEESGGLQSMG